MFEDFQPLNKPLKSGVLLPAIDIEPRFYSELEVSPQASNYEFLRRLCWRGVKERGIDKLLNSKEYYDRVKRELETFEELGFVAYILLNWEVHNFCIEKGIPKGFARGSAASSIVLYLIRVTDIDPIKNGLFFERFVSKSRAKKIIDDGITYLDGSLLADIDSDISYDRRHEVMEFIEKKHSGRTAKILTLGTLSSKLILRECGKIVDNLNEDAVSFISNNVPKAFNIPLDLKDALKESDKLKELAEKYPKTFKVAKKLEGLIKNTGVHASGVAISSSKIDELMPIQMTKDGELVTGFEMGDVASLAVKFDILGLKTLTVVDDCCKQLGINMLDIDENDSSIYEALQNLIAPQGLFQVETDTTFRVCQKVKPRNIDHLTAVIAASRPGTLSLVDPYVKYVETGESQAPHKFLEDVFEDAGGTPMYQESTLRALNKIGFDLESCESARRVIAKKITEKMPEWESKLKEMVAKNNLDPIIGTTLWKVMSDSANYQFAKCHSRAYSQLTAITCWLKFNHPQEFFLSLLKIAKFEQDTFAEISKVTQELSLFGMKLLPPDLSKSKQEFSIEGNNLRFGMDSIKGISEKSIQNLLDFRGHEFQNKYQIFQSAKDCGLNIGILCTLIQAGCLDSFGDNRCKMVLEAQMFSKLTEKEKLSVTELGEHHNHDIFAALKDGAEGKILNAKNKSVFTEKRIEKLREEHSKYKQIYDQNIKHLKFCNWYFEREMLGYSYSYTLRDVFEEKKNTFTPLLEFSSLEDNENIRIVGVVTEVKKATSKKGNKYMMLNISDEGGKLSAMFGDNAKDNKWTRHLEDKLPVPSEDSVVVVYGKKFGDLLMVDKFSIVEDEIYLKLSNVK